MTLVISMFLSYIIIILLIIYFVYLIIKYSGMDKPEYNLQYFRDKEYIIIFYF